MDAVMPTNTFVWIDNPSVSVIYNPDYCGLTGLEALSPMTPSSSSREHTKIYCAGSLSPRSALMEDISPGSSLPESYCKD
jgi:hypothetical protein